MRNKWYETIIAYAEGREVQYRIMAKEAVGEWTTWVGDPRTGATPHFNRPDLEWRVAPTLIYQWVLVNKDGEYMVTSEHHAEHDPELLQYKSIGFRIVQRVEESKVEREA